MIEESQRQLGDALKDLSTEVKDSIATLQSGVNKLVAIEKVTMMALGKSPQECGASEFEGKEKVPEPRPNAGERNAQKVYECRPVGTRCCSLIQGRNLRVELAEADPRDRKSSG